MYQSIIEELNLYLFLAVKYGKTRQRNQWFSEKRMH